MKDDDIVSHMNEYYRRIAHLHDGYMSYTTNENMEKLLGGIIRLFEKDIIDSNLLEIACGTGNWTQVLAKRVRTILAIDVNESMLAIARDKFHAKPNVRFECMDAYDLDKIRGTFNAAFAADWWSHIPRALIRPFLEGLHGKLRQGAKVIFIDMLPSSSLDIESYYYDVAGDFVRKRVLPDGSEFTVIKNFPTENEIREILKGIAKDIRYHEHLNLQRWVLSYSL
jgi:ubiquinone/menaquinone biosynthesis C-methylase UbiE